jgi:type IV pilus biogenesis protein CpaD/CtpE
MLLFTISILLAGCSSESKDISILNNTNEDSSKLEEFIKSNEQISIAVIVLEGDELLTALRMKTFSRFTKRDIGKRIQKELKVLYPDMTVTVFVDNKAIIETKKILNAKNEQNVGEKISNLKSLIKEET